MTDAYQNKATARMAALNIYETDLDEQFIRSGGPGGQHVNKVSTCVRLRHRPTGIEVRCQGDRSRAANREQARLELCEKIAGAAAEKKREKAHQNFLRTMRSKAKRRTLKQKRLAREAKAHRSKTKGLRRRPRGDD